ncbi:hypothetical protein LTS18_010094 [Coniosporium uncinatum]|uniref:Uncharacterized protein n=1 Tax=Coniosporium uncinatum TaxID=93489 RepID=A0ACC3DWL7_9PEZI|nr:hypothetical protein LTS18_010094 [Coniosporium uncinatum]
MGLREEFSEAVRALNEIDFSTSTLEEINVFETTIRYLGGLMAAYDLSGDLTLLYKSRELGDMLYKAFDTPNRMPVLRWDLKAAIKGEPQEAADSVLLAEIGSLTLEFTRLSQITQDPKYYDAIQRVMDIFEEQQMETTLPGMWPIAVNAKARNFVSYTGFTIGGMADSTYEYLPKQYMMLGGAWPQYRRLYEKSLKTMKRSIFYRPMTNDGSDILFPGQITSDGQQPVSNLTTDTQVQHLGCFAGGMVAVGAKIFRREAQDMDVAKKLVEGCLWAYEKMPNGIMPEILHTVQCPDPIECDWNEMSWYEQVNKSYPGTDSGKEKAKKYHLPRGVSKVDDTRYVLRPEAIESVFILYRITGDASLRERAWTMFENIIKLTKTNIAHAGLIDCLASEPPKNDRMESFWLAETLKYFYLIFSEPSMISLDEYVLNTEAHPFKRPG